MDCRETVATHWDTGLESTTELCHRPLPCSIHGKPQTRIWTLDEYRKAIRDYLRMGMVVICPRQVGKTTALLQLAWEMQQCGEAPNRMVEIATERTQDMADYFIVNSRDRNHYVDDVRCLVRSAYMQGIHDMLDVTASGKVKELVKSASPGMDKVHLPAENDPRDGA